MAEQGGTPGPNSRNRIVAAVVVSVLVTASAAGGVGAVAELSDPDSSVVEQLTTGAPNETTQPQFPPGTNESGVTNATALLQAHHNTLQNTSYSSELTSEDVSFASDANRTGGEWETSTATIVVEKGQAGTNTSVVARGDQSQYWVTENATATRTAHSERNSTTVLYRHQENRTDRPSVYGISRELRPAAIVLPYLEALNYTYQGTVTRGNDTLHQLVSTGINRSTDSAASNRLSSNVETVSARLLVSERGVIRQFNATVEHARRNETATTQLNYSVDGVGNTTTSEPAWVDGQLPHFDASVTENGRVLALQYVGGYSPTNETQSPVGVFVSAPNVDARTSLTTPLSPGDTVYLWNVNGTQKLAKSVNDPPSVNESFVAFGGERVAVSMTRYVFRSHVTGTANSYSTVELRVLNETVVQNGTVTRNELPPGTVESATAA
jgi:hypothetical protein